MGSFLNLPLIFFLISCSFTGVIIYLVLRSDPVEKEDDGGSSNPSSYSEPRRSAPKEEYVRLLYQLQVRGGHFWLNIGGPMNEDGAMRSAEYEKSRNPNKRYRVVELRNGRVGNTVYSC
jgi:hypothetical protein